MRRFVLSVLISSAVAHAEVSVVNRQLEPGQTISGALRAAGVDAISTQRLIEALDDVADLRLARSGQQLRIVRVDGFVENLDYRVGTLDEYQVRRDGWRYVAARRAISYERHIERFDFDVETSLWQAAQSTGRDPVVAMALSDAFGWEVDLVREARIGDRAKVLVETLTHRGRVVRYGDVLAARYEKVKGGRVEVFRYEQPDGDRGWYFSDGTSAQRTFLKSPVGWAPISSRFGWRLHPVEQLMKFHDGVDYSMPTGTPVRAVASGLVTFAGYTAGGGNSICVMHEGDYESCYLHLSRIAQSVRTDATVFRKQVIAWSGNTGNTTAPHLHFNLKHEQKYVDPLRQNFPRAEALPTDCRSDFDRAVARYTAQLDDERVPVGRLR